MLLIFGNLFAMGKHQQKRILATMDKVASLSGIQLYSVRESV